MTHLIHTEYILAGRTSKDVRDVLRSSMFAATVTGSPVENACRLIKKYETEGPRLLRRRDGAARPRRRRAGHRRRPILLRTADVGLDGRLRVTAGATLVRDSDPAYEVAETHAKAGGILTRLRPGSARRATPPADIAELAADEDVLSRSAGATSGSAGSGSTTSPTPRRTPRWPASTSSSSTARTTSSRCCGTCSACSA